MPTLIITEKPNVAERIANSLGNAEKISRNGISYYGVDDNFIVPAVGHIYGLNEKKKGTWTYPVFDIDWMPSYKVTKASEFTKKYLENIKFLSEKCNNFINACDYDIEGEVIGFNVIKHACNQDPLQENVMRMRYSTLTSESIINAYKNLEPINKGMAYAGLTRHTLDWYWGINLSRALTLAVRRAHGYVTLSIGRVQGPTLKILAARDRLISEFKPEPYWQIEMISSKGEKRLSAFHSEDKFWEKDKASKAKDNCGNIARVVQVEKKKFKQPPVTPFDLTTLQTEAYKQLKIDPRRTLEVAQELYTNAYISYPRTSSQQLPPGINYSHIIENLGRIQEYGQSADVLIKKKKIKPNNGKKKDPAHPAIYPTGEIPKNLNADASKIYDLIVRRFFATFGEPAIRETVNIKLDNNSEIFVAEGTRTIDAGWHHLYGKYAKFEEEELPSLEKGEELNVEDIKIHEKETKPQKKYTPASIIREMEKKNLGTKATRSQIVDILFRRGYLKGKTIEVTPLGMNVVDTLGKYCPEVLSEKLTRKFEKEMEGIEAGKIPSEKVIGEGRETIIKISNEFKENESEIGKALAGSLLSTRTASSLGACHKCGGNLVLRKSKFGSQFVGCANYPKCNYIISLPKGKLKESGRCKQCDYSTIMVFGGTRPWGFCINPECPSKKNFAVGKIFVPNQPKG